VSDRGQNPLLSWR